MIKKCLFPVAGYGTRFLPATKAVPKEILPVLDKPLVQYGVEEAAEAGLIDICFVTGRGKRAIEDHFDKSYELEHLIAGTSREKALGGIRDLMERCTFSYTRQIEIKGLGDAILKGRTIVGDQPFGVLLADDLCFGKGGGVLKQLLHIFKKYRCSIMAIQEVLKEETAAYGIIAGDPINERLFRVTDIVEKPKPEEAPSNLAAIGRYILTPDIFVILKIIPPGKNGELQIADALQLLAAKGHLIAYKFKGRRFDCGCVGEYVAATNYCYKQKFGKRNK